VGTRFHHLVPTLKDEGWGTRDEDSVFSYPTLKGEGWGTHESLIKILCLSDPEG